MANIWLKSRAGTVYLPEGTSFAMWTDNYEADVWGKKHECEDVPLNEIYDFGDLIIETVERTFIFRRIYACYSCYEELMEMIEKDSWQSELFADLDELSQGDPVTVDLEIIYKREEENYA